MGCPGFSSFPVDLVQFIAKRSQFIFSRYRSGKLPGFLLEQTNCLFIFLNLVLQSFLFVRSLLFLRLILRLLLFQLSKIFLQAVTFQILVFLFPDPLCRLFELFRLAAPGFCRCECFLFLSCQHFQLRKVAFILPNLFLY